MSNVVPPVKSLRAQIGSVSAPRLADLTTLRVGGAVASYVEAASEEEMVATIKEADAAGAPLLVLGGGSNILASDADFPGVVLRDARQEIEVEANDSCGGVSLRVTAGLPWDELVARAVSEDWMGLEALSGIPGTVGAAPVQNVGAYGSEVSQTLASVRVFDRERGRVRLLAVGELELGYRTSVLKTSRQSGQWGPTGRYVVLSTNWQLRHASLSAPVRYKELAAKLGVELGERAPSADVRAAVLELRRGKGMLLDDADPDTFSAGSFFLNPVLTADVAAGLPEGAPRFEVRDGALASNIGVQGPVVPGVVKTSAAWLISNAGFERGFGLELTEGRACLSTKHSLAITNRGSASAADVEAVAAAVVAGVRAKFGIELEAEPVRV
ncbi:MAG: UDP-N-acetylmuramate dehydrogenase [Buchananella hordeovulneris]|nr:UDP-N-acetylmuramate dehydrogenase [Buchananella hordeovulneris]